AFLNFASFRSTLAAGPSGNSVRTTFKVVLPQPLASNFHKSFRAVISARTATERRRFLRLSFAMVNDRSSSFQWRQQERGADGQGLDTANLHIIPPIECPSGPTAPRGSVNNLAFTMRRNLKQHFPQTIWLSRSLIPLPLSHACRTGSRPRQNFVSLRKRRN